MGVMLGLTTCTVRMTSASRTGNLSLNEVSLIEINWNVGSFGFAVTRAAVAVAATAPIKAEFQLHFTFLPMTFFVNYSILGPF